jgi:hypothetical protein
MQSGCLLLFQLLGLTLRTPHDDSFSEVLFIAVACGTLDFSLIIGLIQSVDVVSGSLMPLLAVCR